MFKLGLILVAAYIAVELVVVSLLKAMVAG